MRRCFVIQKKSSEMEKGDLSFETEKNRATPPFLGANDSEEQKTITETLEAYTPTKPGKEPITPLENQERSDGSKVDPTNSGTVSFADKDPITGFFYKFYFDKSIKTLTVRASQNKRPLSMLWFKLDKHKELRYHYGQEKLNNILGDITATIQKFLKETIDVPVRYSDELFVILLPDTTFQIASNLAEQIRFTIGNQRFRNIPDQITLSLGIASFPDKGNTPKELKKNSYDAMVYAIKQGGNRSIIWQDDLIEKL